MHRTLLMLLFTVLALPPGLRATDPPKTPADTLKAIQQEQRQNEEKLDKAYPTAKTDAQRNKLFEENRKGNEACARRAVELARKHPKDPVAWQALVWVTTGGIGFSPPTVEALDLIRKDYISDKRLAPVVRMGFAYWSIYPETEEFLREAVQKNPGREVQGLASLNLARLLADDAEASRMAQADPAWLKRWEVAQWPKALIKKWRTSDPDKLTKEAERVYQQIIDRYADVKPEHSKLTLGRRAEAALFEIRHLTVGRKAPEIAGEDIDGKRFKLSDYRGKVVLLDFWGNW
jgi:hypothetical protein